MPATASTVTTIAFVALVIVMLGVVVLGIERAFAGRAGSRGGLLTAVIVIVAVIVPGVLTALHLLDRYTPPPAPAILLLIGIVAANLGLAFSPLGKRLATGLPLAALVGFQAFRIPVELILHRLHSEGVVPIQMTYLGRNFDVVSGLTAIVVALLVWKGRAPRALVLAWNILGLALLLNIIAIAVLSTPMPFRTFLNEPANLLPSTFPFVWLPSFLVQIALLGHLLVFRALRSRD